MTSTDQVGGETLSYQSLAVADDPDFTRVFLWGGVVYGLAGAAALGLFYLNKSDNAFSGWYEISLNISVLAFYFGTSILCGAALAGWIRPATVGWCMRVAIALMMALLTISLIAQPIDPAPAGGKLRFYSSVILGSAAQLWWPGVMAVMLRPHRALDSHAALGTAGNRLVIASLLLSVVLTIDACLQLGMMAIGSAIQITTIGDALRLVAALFPWLVLALCLIAWQVRSHRFGLMLAASCVYLVGKTQSIIGLFFSVMSHEVRVLVVAIALGAICVGLTFFVAAIVAWRTPRPAR